MCGAFSTPLPHWTSQEDDREEDVWRVRRGRLGVPQAWPCASGSPAHVCCGPSLLFRLLMLSSGHELELCASASPVLVASSSSIPPPFIYGTDISSWREVANILKWHKGLNENKVFV